MSKEIAEHLERELHKLIPLSAAMGIRIAELTTGGIVLEAPLDANRNHAGSAFAGSQQAIASLAGWAFLRHATVAAGVPAHLVLGEGTARFHHPLEGTLRAVLHADSDELAAVLERLARGRRARLTLPIYLPDPQRPATTFTGRFVALPGAEPG